MSPTRSHDQADGRVDGIGVARICNAVAISHSKMPLTSNNPTKENISVVSNPFCFIYSDIIYIFGKKV
jgi:hypothetical protein